MKRYILAVLAMILTVGMFVSFSNGKTKVIKEGGILSVDDVQGDPSAYKGTITVTGVVAGVSSRDKKVFAIVETMEAKTCKQTGCAPCKV